MISFPDYGTGKTKVQIGFQTLRTVPQWKFPMNNCFGKLLKQRREDARAQVIRSLLKTQLFHEIKETVTVAVQQTS